MTVAKWGMTGSGPAHRIEIHGGGSARAVLTDFGARLVQLWLPDRDGRLADVVLGHDRAEEYDTSAGRYVGATCGRYANRIEGARFRLEGQDVHLVPNGGSIQLHGGPRGFDLALWQIIEHSENSVRFQLRSPDGDMGFPGDLTALVTYAFTAPSRLEITFEAHVAGRPTVVNLVNHAYFNLAGQGSGPIDEHLLRIDAERYLPVDPSLIPIGPPASVDGTPFDFRHLRRLDAAVPPGGFDHNFCLSDTGAPQIELQDPTSGRGFTLWTDQPGVQVYTAGHIPPDSPGKSGARIGPRAGLALETQRWPNSPNRPDFPSPLLRPGEVYHHRMIFDFFTR